MDWAPLADNIIERPSPNYGYSGARPHWRAVTWHIAEGNLDGTLSWLTSPESDASSHFVVARDGQIYHLVSLDEAAWCQGHVCAPNLANPIIQQTVSAGINPNLVSYSIECVGYSSWGKGGSLTQPQSDALIRLTAYLCNRSRLSSDQTHILGHYEWDRCTRSGCPGYSYDEWLEWVERVHALTSLWRGW
jgi:N-acetyl-anhydromuramyl-L-alanine amidase AmpD